VVQGQGAITVTGSGSQRNPYVVSGGGVLNATDTATIDLTLTGEGSDTDPYQLSAAATISLEEILDVDASLTTAGYVLARQADGTFSMVPPATATPGLVTHDVSLFGDGSAGNPIGVARAWLDSYFGASGGNLDSRYVTQTQLTTLNNTLTQMQAKLNEATSRLDSLPFRLDTGTVGINPVPNQVTSGHVDFRAGYFTTTPLIWTSAYTTVPGVVDYTSAQHATKDGCDIFIYRKDSTGTAIRWLAIQMNE
jgi:hypothetical protein